MSGGQSGADRAALDAAICHGTDYGGWCPRGGWAEDFPEPPGLLTQYPHLRETPGSDPAQRTRWNVRDSDATLIVRQATAAHSAGTTLTQQVAAELGRPILVTDPTDVDDVMAWIGSLLPGSTLNVAGPRESETPGSYAACFDLVSRILATRVEDVGRS